MHSTLQKDLVVGLQHQFSSFGFRWNASAQSFRRKTVGGWDAVHLTFIRHGDIDFDVTIDFGIRVDAVEEVVFEEDVIMPKSERKNMACIGVELGNLTSGEPRRWTIANAEDVHRAVEEISREVRSTGLSFFERFSNLNEVLAVLMDDGPIGLLHCPFHAIRCKRAIALAFLLGKLESADQRIISG
jgi:hypothetical protein